MYQEFPETELAYQVQLRLGRSYYKNNQFDKAISILHQSLSNIPEDGSISSDLLLEAYSFLGLAYSRLEEHHSAIEQFEHVLTLTDDPVLRANTLFKIADGYYRLGEYEQAQSFYTRLIQDYPDASEILDAQYSLIHTHLQLGETDQYVATSKAFLNIPQGASQPSESGLPSPSENPQAPVVLYQLGGHYVAQQEYEDALSLFQQFVVSYPEHELVEESLYGIGLCHLKMQNYPQAVREFQQLVSRFPQSEYASDAHYGMATAYFKQQDYPAAITNYALILQDFPEYPLNDRTMLNLGTALLQTGDFAKAADILQQSIDQYPNQSNISEVYLKLGYALTQQKKCEQAIPVLGQAVAGAAVAIAAEAQFRIGECYAELDERDKAIVDYLKVVYLYPDQHYWGANAQFKAAMIYEDIGKKEEALKLYQKIIQASQEQTLVEKAQQRVSALTQKTIE